MFIFIITYLVVIYIFYTFWIVFYKNINETVGNYGDIYETIEDRDSSNRDKLKRLRDKIGVGIDSLPEIKFESWEEIKDPPDEEENNEIQRLCLTIGVYLGPNDEYVDCLSYCSVSDGVDYKFFSKSGSIISGREGRKGAYCLPTDAAICNENTSIVFYSKYGWRCFPQMRAFAGVGGNKIVCCRGNLLDRATGKVWKEYIDSNLKINDIDEPLTDGTFRFVCPPTLDSIGNKMIEAPFDRLLLLENSCARMIPYGNLDIKPNLSTGICICGDQAEFNNEFDCCVPIVRSKWTDFEYPLKRSKCVERWTNLETFQKEHDYKYFCGFDQGKVDTSYPSVVITKFQALDRPTPSPYILREHFNKQ